MSSPKYATVKGTVISCDRSEQDKHWVVVLRLWGGEYITRYFYQLKPLPIGSEQEVRS